MVPLTFRKTIDKASTKGGGEWEWEEDANRDID